MADIDQILAGGAGAGSRYDFSTIGDPVKSFFDASQQRAAFDTRRAFKDGLPMDPETNQPDWGAVAKTLIQKGDLNQGIAAANLGLQQQNMKFGQGQSTDISNVERGGNPPPRPLLAPSTGQSASVPDRQPRISQGGESSQSSVRPTATIMQAAAAQGIPNDQLQRVTESIARQLGPERVGPNGEIDLNDTGVTNILVPAIAQFKKNGIGQIAPPGTPQQQPIQPIQPGSAAPMVPTPIQTQRIPAPVTESATTTTAPQTPSRNDQLIAFYSGIMSDPRSPKQNVELAKERLAAIQKNSEFTPLQKEYAQAISQGFKGTMQDFAADMETRKTAATKEAELGSTKYQSIIENGTKAQMEIPQLELLQEQMNDPNFFSGAGEKYNLLYKRLKSAVGIDPEAAVPQEYLRKATAANVLSSLGALKGLGQIRVAEINMAREAAASPENSVPANKLLVEISKRTHQRNADIAEMAQNYKEQNGTLDPGFDKQVTAYYKKNPLFSDAEIKDWHKVIGQSKTASAAPPMPGAKQAPDGNFYLPDPNRPGKYLKVVQ
jgi:hypothetical protein